MFSEQPTPDSIRADWGDHVLTGLAQAIDDGRAQYQDLRQQSPGLLPMLTNRTTANIIHDMIWAAMQRRLDGMPGVELRSREPVREIQIGNHYALRLKRHGLGDVVVSYPTDGAKAFWRNSRPLPGFDRWTLAVGYRWNPVLHEMGNAVVSFRDGMANPIWVVDITASPGSVAGFTWTPVTPQLPQLDLSQLATDERTSWA